MRSFALTCLVFLAACGGGGSDAGALAANPGEGAGEGTTQPTATELFAGCFQQDATQLARILGLLEGFFNNDGSQVPMPTLDLISGLLSGGNIPYTWDLDGDTVNELSGTLRFIDESGATTIPFSLAELSRLDINDPASLLAAIPAGSRLELNFDVGGTLLAATNAGAGEGTLVFRFGEATVGGIAGGGSFTSGECVFEIDFDEIAIDPEMLTGYPVGSAGFTAAIGTDSLAGTISLDGTATADVSVSLNGGTPEQTTIELPDLSGLGGAIASDG